MRGARFACVRNENRQRYSSILFDIQHAVRSENRQRYVSTAGVFAAVCVVGDLLVSCFPQLSDARQQNDVFLVVMSAIIFYVGYAHIRHEKSAAGNAEEAAASEFAKTESASSRGEHEARQAAKQLTHHSTIAQARWKIQAEGTTPVAPPEVERAASHAAQTAGPLTEPPQKPRKAPRYVSRSSAGARVSADSEDTTNKPLDENDAERAHHSAHDRYVSPSSEGAGLPTESEDTTNNPVPRNIPWYVSPSSEDAGLPTESEDTPHHPAPRDILHTATSRTPLRREASSFVPDDVVLPWWKVPCQTAMLCNLAPYAWSQYDEFLQTGIQHMGYQRDEHTTVRLNNLPLRFLREDLVKEMDAKGFSGIYNYVYIPTDVQTQRNIGYGFVNLISAGEVQRFILAFDGFRDWPVPSSKICFVDLAWVQGLDNNVEMYRNSSIMSDEVPERFRPVLFDGAERVPFPEPAGDLHHTGRNCDEHTTVILKNLPCPFLRESLIKEMDAKGFAGLYNYVYVPTDFQRQLSKGYGFVNLISAEEVQRFIIAFDGFRDWPIPSSKACSADLARVQGLDNNVWMYRNSAIMGDEVPERFRPVLFDGTERVPFPEPTEELPKVVRSAQNVY